MATPANPTRELVADLKAAQRITQKVKWTLMILSTVFLVGLITYFIIYAIRSEEQLKQLVVGMNSIVQNQSNELAQIKANQTTNNEQNANRIADISSNLQKQDAYMKCIIEGNRDCVQPTYNSAETSTQPSQSTQSNQPAQNSQPAQPSKPSPVTIPTVPVTPTPPTPKPSFARQILTWLGL